MGPASPVDTLGTAEQDEVEHRAIDDVGVVPVIGSRPHDDHRLTVGSLGVAGELAGDADHQAGVDAGDVLLPCRRVRLLGVHVVIRPVPREPLASDPVLGEREIQDRGDELPADPLGRNAPPHRRRRPACGVIKADQLDVDHLVVDAQQREQRVNLTKVEVPSTLPFGPPPEANRTLWDDRLAVAQVDQHRLPLRVLRCLTEVRCTEEAPRLMHIAGRIKSDREMGDQ